MSTKTLTQKPVEQSSMDEQELWYLSASFDTVGRMKIEIKEKESMKIGYRIKPLITYSRPEEAKVIFGMFDEYSEEVGFHYRIVEQKNSMKLEIDNVKNARRFLEPIMGGFIQQRERAEFFMEDVLPLFDDGYPTAKEQFIEAVEVADELAEYTISSTSKYDADYFKDLWEM